MRILDEYLAQFNLLIICWVAACLLGLELFFDAINELKYLHQGDYGFLAMVQYLSCLIPRKLYAQLHWSSLIGTVLSLHHLMSTAEITIIRTTARFSVPRIGCGLALGALPLLIVSLLLGEFLGTELEQWGHAQRTKAISAGQILQSDTKAWFKKGNSIYFVKKINDAENLEDIVKFNLKFDASSQVNQVDGLDLIQKAQFDASTKTWILHHIQTLKIQQDHIERSLEKTKRVPQDHFITTKAINTDRVKHLERLPFHVLLATCAERKQEQLDAREYQFAIASKLLHPFYILGMSFFAIPILFGSVRQGHLGLRLLMGILVGFGIHSINGIWIPIAKHHGIPALLAVPLPLLIYIALSTWLIKKRAA